MTTLPRQALSFACMVLLCATAAAAQPTELFISEYIEGSSNNKAIEIYNGTGAAVNLLTGGYSIQMFFNGSATAGLTIALTGTVAAGDVYVVAQSSANAAILAQADQTNGAGWFNGDDVVVLRKGAVVVDSIGKIGEDPGTEWGTGLTSTADNTLRRKASICAGDTNTLDAFNPATEFDGFATDNVAGLGAHSTTCLPPNAPVIATCGAPLSVFQGFPTSRVVTASDADGTVIDLAINSVTPSPAPGTILRSAFTPAAAVGGTASATIDVSNTVPAGSYSVLVTGTNNDAPTPQTGTCALVVNVIGPKEIWEIQGSGAASPFNTQVVLTENNIVTALGYSAGVANGFFIQTPPARADLSDQTSNGIFVFTGGVPSVSVGDQVDVTGTVQEFFNMTEISGALTISIDSSGNALPPAFLFTQVAPGVFVPSHNQPIGNEFERFEGMLVRVENGRAAAPTDNFGDTPIVADSTRPFREPGVEYPGGFGYPIIWDGNPEIFEINPDGAGLPNVSLFGGATIDVAEGPLMYSFNDYQIWPTTFTYTQPAPALPRAVRARNPGELTVGSQNLLRYFDDDPTNGPDDGPVTPQQFQDRLQKASLHIRTVMGAPDVLVVEEVENIGTLQALAARILVDDPAAVYTAYLMEGHDVGGIDTGMLVRDTVAVNSVTQVGFASTLSLDGSFLHDRPPLVLDATYLGNGTPFPITVIGVHNRSLSGVEANTPTGNRVRQKRLEQALELANYIQGLQADPTRRVVVTGDFNAFQFSDGLVDAVGIISGNLDPNGAIQPGHADVVNPDLIDHVNSQPAGERYSFLFGGSAQVLDHTLTTVSLNPNLRGLQYSRGNADAPVAVRSDPTTALGTSDHDGEVLFIMTDADGDGLLDDMDNCAADPNPGQQDYDGDNIGNACDDDDDNDGVLDTADACQLSSPMPAFVTIDACTTDVPDVLLTNGCSISESIATMAGYSWNHGSFVSQVAHFSTDLRKDGVITNKDRADIMRCAAWANVP